jgi:hypothetical protein
MRRPFFSKSKVKAGVGPQGVGLYDWRTLPRD